MHIDDVKVLKGTPTHRRYEPELLLNLPTKKVEAVASTTHEGAYGEALMTVLLFDDGTFHGFVHASHDDD